MSCGAHLPDNLGASADLTLIRLRVDDISGPDFASTEDREHFGAILHYSRLAVIFPETPGLDAGAIAAEVFRYLEGARVVSVVECAATAGLAWTVFSLRAAPATVIIPVYPTPIGIGAQMTALPRTLH